MRIFIVVSLLFLMAADAPDEATRRWWEHVKILAADNMEGRDTGSEGYRRAERYVIEQFERAGLKPAGESGYIQTVPLRAVRLRKEQSSVALVKGDRVTPLRIYQDVTVTPRVGMAAIDAPLVFAGDDLTGVDFMGKVAVTIAVGRPRNTGALGNLTIDNPRATEPQRWPVSYATVMSIGSARGRTESRCGSIRPKRGSCSKGPGIRFRSYWNWWWRRSLCRRLS